MLISVSMHGKLFVTPGNLEQATIRNPPGDTFAINYRFSKLRSKLWKFFSNPGNKSIDQRLALQNGGVSLGENNI